MVKHRLYSNTGTRAFGGGEVPEPDEHEQNTNHAQIRRLDFYRDEMREEDGLGRVLDTPETIIGFGWNLRDFLRVTGKSVVMQFEKFR